MPAVYRIDQEPFEVGRVLEPGYFSEPILAGGSSLSSREVVLEIVRQRVAPAAPSRLHCVFTLASARFALRLAGWWSDDAEDGRPFSYMHTLEPAAGAAMIRVDMGWLTGTAAMQPSELTPIAHRYWSGTAMSGEPGWEVLIGGPCTVVHCGRVGEG
jgi:hypothetical protein